MISLRCLLAGCDFHRVFADHRVHLRCQRCGRETAGWRDDDLPRPRVIFAAPVRRKFRLVTPKAKKARTA